MAIAEGPPHGRAAEPVPVAPVRLLVADDNPANQKVALAMLAKLGFVADAVTNGAEAVEAVRAHQYAAILMDCQMPVMDGYEATSVIRALEGGRARVPIIAVTASVMAGAKEKCLAAGMDDYVAKPIIMNGLHEVLDRWIRRPHEPESPIAVTAGGDPADVFDAGRVAALRAIDMPGTSDAFTHFATMFLDDAVEQLAALDQALSDGDAERARREAHSLRGAAATVGAHHLAELCGVLEEQVAGGVPSAADALAPIRLELDRVRSSLQRLPPHGERNES